jgi:hypothetical protein
MAPELRLATEVVSFRVSHNRRMRRRRGHEIGHGSLESAEPTTER